MGTFRLIINNFINISKAADAVVQTEYVCEELSTKRFKALVFRNLEKEQCFSKCKTSEGLCTKARDFKLMCSTDYNNYSEGTRCFAK